jgi:hypothetical protein
LGITNGYATLAEVKARLFDADDTSVTQFDSELENVIEGVSRWIDEDRGRQFYATTSQGRYFTAEQGDVVVIDDLLSLTSLKTDEDADGTFERVWTAADYLLYPYNASNKSQPYTAIERSVLGNLVFPTVRRGVEVTGTWGYSTTAPKQIKEACILGSMRLWKRRDAIFGVAGAADLGQAIVIARLDTDPELRQLLGSVNQRWVF